MDWVKRNSLLLKRKGLSTSVVLYKTGKTKLYATMLVSIMQIMQYQCDHRVLTSYTCMSSDYLFTVLLITEISMLRWWHGASVCPQHTSSDPGFTSSEDGRHIRQDFSHSILSCLDSTITQLPLKSVNFSKEAWPILSSWQEHEDKEIRRSGCLFGHLISFTIISTWDVVLSGHTCVILDLSVMLEAS